MAARFAELTEAEIVALLKKLTPENTKATKYRVETLNGKFTKIKKYSK